MTHCRCCHRWASAVTEVRSWYPEALYPADGRSPVGAMARLACDEVLAAGRGQPNILQGRGGGPPASSSMKDPQLDPPLYEVRILLPLSTFSQDWLDLVTGAAETQMPVSVSGRIVD